MNFRAFPLLLAASLGLSAHADGPSDNQADRVRRIPPPGISVDTADRAELGITLQRLADEIASLRASLEKKPGLRELLPDVQIFQKAVRYALQHDEFFSTNEIPLAKALLNEGLERAQALRDGQAPWNTATGLVVRGYLSKIDGSVQPYGLVIPSSFHPGTTHRFRLDAWFHGRDEKLSELSFLNARQKSAGEFTPPNAFVLHLYGRYCNANKFAGEIDLFEALDDVRQHYPIDNDRLVVRGFSMGGAACWQFATHYAGLWAAAAPGAGFSETADFLKVFQNESVQPASYEQKLWHWYDSTDYAVNLFNCPTVAYSGEIDKQKQAADMMAKALAAEGIELTHIIGPQTAHKYHPQAKQEINRRIDSIVERGRDPVPRKIRFTTWTLRYNQMLWVTVDGLAHHWERARVDAEILDDHTIRAKTENVTELTFAMAPGQCPLDISRKSMVELDGVSLEAPRAGSDRSWTAHFARAGSTWKVLDQPDNGLRKEHGLQGPIDDAFMDSFLMVHATGHPMNATVGSWTHEEETHAFEHWRRQFRGEARFKKDIDITDADIASNNLVLWGDPSSNHLLARIAAQLPIRWDSMGVHIGDADYSADRYAPVLIYPNPLNPKRYVVLNSGFTYREYDYLNNARQVPKLPDFAIMDLAVPPSSRAPGGIARAGFFDEKWQLPKE
jgi:pimeloyl-ACP methyl ester carboxylesterase